VKEAGTIDLKAKEVGELQNVEWDQPDPEDDSHEPKTFSGSAVEKEVLPCVCDGSRWTEQV
jgi:hypothetical protein